MACNPKIIATPASESKVEIMQPLPQHNAKADIYSID